MRPSQLASFLAAAIPAKHNILITGAPGLGKSDIVSQAAEAAGADLILSHPAVSDPTDAKGLPWVGADGQSATFLPFGDLAKAMKAEKLTVWFLDDFGQATAATQSSFMQLLLAREVNGKRLSDHVMFVAATNRRTDRANVQGVLEPVKSRFASIVELNADLDDWTTWAFSHNIPAELVAFLRFKTELLSAFQASADLTNSPTPRTWSNVAKLLALRLPTDLQYEAIKGAVGEGAAGEFMAFLRLWQEMPNIDAILIDPSKGKIPQEPATLYAVVTALALRTDETTFPRIGQYAERLAHESRGEFAALLVRDAIRHGDQKIQQSAAFAKLMVGPLGQLVTGRI